MNVYKTILLTFFSIVGTAVIAVLMWTCLYLTVPNIKDKTDQIFKWNDYKVEEKADEQSKATCILPGVTWNADANTLTIGR